MTALVCQRQGRRENVRAHQQLNGLDYVEVSEGNDGKPTLTVYCLGKAPLSLDKTHILIEGGRRIRDLQVTKVTTEHYRQAELDDRILVTLNQAGDFSTYTLRVVSGRDATGNWQPHPAFDPHYDRVEFSFKADCASDLDPRQQPVCVPKVLPEPDIDYQTKDYASFRQLLFDRLALLIPGWQERHVPDLGVTLVELLAYVGDHLSYYQDAVATEAYLATARQRISVQRHARLVDYNLHAGCNARTWVCVATDTDLTLPSDVFFITRQPHAPWVLRESELRDYVSQPYNVFEPVLGQGEVIRLYAGQQTMRFYTWGDHQCCLPIGTTSATVTIMPDAKQEEVASCQPVADTTVQQSPIQQQSPQQQSPQQQHPVAVGKGKPATPTVAALRLQVGDVLLFEEVKGAKTGKPGDANPKHRHAVRLTQVQQGYDPLAPDVPLVEIHWAEADALPFPLCISSQTTSPPCGVIEDVSVARGNLVLVDHGLTVAELLPPVPLGREVNACDGYGDATDSVLVPGRFEPALQQFPLVFAEPLDASLPASRMLQQDARRALPQVTLQNSVTAQSWQARSDLLASHERDLHFVVETDEAGRGRLRFGNGELGKRPAVGAVLQARYRMGGGQRGNVGAQMITHVVTRSSHVSGGITGVFNPMVALGGVDAEPVQEAKHFIPDAMRKHLERAITAQDYADLVMREFPHQVQRAAARLRWNGSWQQVLLAIDPLGREQADAGLLAAIAARLHRYRRIGHDLVVQPAQRVPLEITLLVCVQPGYHWGHVKAALLAVFSNRRLPDGRLGFFHPDKLSFGDGIHRSKLVATAQAVQGVASVEVKTLKRFGDTKAASDSAIADGILRLGVFEIARLDNDPSVPENGILRVVDQRVLETKEGS